MNTLIQERHNHDECFITVEMSRRTQKIEIYLANEESGLPFFNTELGHIFRSSVANELGVILIGKSPHKPDFAYDIVRKHSLTLYTDLIEDFFVGDTKALLQRYFLFLSKLKAGDIITIGVYMNYHTCSNLQFRPLLKNSFHSIHIQLRDKSGEKVFLFICRFNSFCSDAQKSLQQPFLTWKKNVTRWLLQD